MTELIVKVEEEKKELIENLLKELGCEVRITPGKKIGKKSIEEKITPFSILANGKILTLIPKLSEKNYGTEVTNFSRYGYYHKSDTGQ